MQGRCWVHQLNRLQYWRDLRTRAAVLKQHRCAAVVAGLAAVAVASGALPAVVAVVVAVAVAVPAAVSRAVAAVVVQCWLVGAAEGVRLNIAMIWSNCLVCN